VHNDIGKINEYPLSAVLALNANRLAVVFFRSLNDRIRYGASMSSGPTVRDDHKIRNRSQMPNIQTRYGFGFEIVEYVYDELD
jgi:hypothetical protein